MGVALLHLHGKLLCGVRRPHPWTATVEVCGKADAESSLADVAVSDLIAMVWPRIVLVVALLRGLRSKAFFAYQQSPRAR